MSLLLLWTGIPHATPGKDFYHLLSQLIPQHPRVINDKFWDWLRQQIEIAKRELEGRVQLIYCDISSSASLDTAQPHSIKAYELAEGIYDVKTPVVFTIQASGQFAAVTDERQVRIRFGGVVVAETTLSIDNTDVDWYIEAEVVLINQIEGRYKSETILQVTKTENYVDDELLIPNIFNNATLITVEVESSDANANSMICSRFLVYHARIEVP